MMCPRDIFLGYMFDEGLLDLIGCVVALRHQTYAMGYSKHMCIDGHRGFAESDALYDISSLATYAWEIQ